eukprot:1146465-Pelagomonas_calceolata.AAC.2
METRQALCLGSPDKVLRIRACPACSPGIPYEVKGPKCAGSGSWRAVTAGGSIQTSVQPA